MISAGGLGEFHPFGGGINAEPSRCRWIGKGIAKNLEIILARKIPFDTFRLPFLEKQKTVVSQ